MSQTELANALGLSRSALANYETGTREPSIDMLLKMADFFDVTMDQLVRLDFGSAQPDTLLLSEEQKKAVLVLLGGSKK